ncbi:3-oxoacyl-[acyl-carrier protein] reductase [Sphingopyxis macrogoltabida]|nr:3-oxoacyl-[acyl-carrier protein] reductase [Sphingopyxis macrogoltabida]
MHARHPRLAPVEIRRVELPHGEPRLHALLQTEGIGMNKHWANVTRWSDNDRHFGRFLFAAPSGHYRSTGIMLATGGDEDSAHNTLRFMLRGWTVMLKLPEIIKPYRRKVHYSTPDIIAQAQAAGRDTFYWDQHRREFGFSAAEGAVHWHYGPQTHDSTTTKSKCWFYPWREHQCIRHSIYDLDGDLFAHLPEWGFRSKNGWAARNALQDACPVAKFEFDDFDGERISATCRIEEMEWKRGKGIFRLLFLGRNSVARSLDLRFSSEVGQRKGSWKGGTIGHSIEMLPGELHEAAFRRYCEKQGLTFVGPSPNPLAEMTRLDDEMGLQDVALDRPS